MKKQIALLFFIFLTAKLLAQDNIILKAKDLFDQGSYSASQSILNNMPTQDQTAEIMYFNARCSKELFSDDAIFLYSKLNTCFPFHQFREQVSQHLALIYYREKQYSDAISCFLEIKDLSNEHLFKLAYSYFSIDSLSEAQFYFSRIMNVESKFASTSTYYYAYILYKSGMYKSALKNFKILLNDDKFARIVPYYITQIYFYQKKYHDLIIFARPLLKEVIASRKSEINRLLAEAYYRTNDFKNAIYHFEEFILEEKTQTSLGYFLLGHAYFKTEDYGNAIYNLEKALSSSDSITQYSSYYLGASYLHLEHYNYGLQAFKKSASFNYNKQMQEDAYYNYVKLSYQLELPFDNTLEALTGYLEIFENPIHVNEIEVLIAKTLQSTTKYYQAYITLKEIPLPSYDQKRTLQQLAFFLGVKEFNKQNFNEAIAYFNNANQYSIDPTYSYLSNFWLADCYFQLRNYEKAIDNYSGLSSLAIENIAYYETLRKYNLGYSYFQHGDYVNAVRWFRSYEMVASDSMKINDSYLRIADSYFMINDFSLSAKYYKKARELALFDVDYALYQNSLVSGLLGKDLLKVDLLENIVLNFSSSTYFDNAIYDLARYYKNISDYDLANKYYDDLIAFSDDNNLVADAHLSKGMISFNIGKVEKAIDAFLFVVNNYQQTEYFKEALSGLQSAYASIANIEKYLAIIDSLPEFSITEAEQDSLTYNTAFMKFSEMDYAIAKSTFDKYLLNFKSGIFADDAVYYNAISSLKIGDTTSAILNYKKVLEGNALDHQEKALIFLARISFNSNDYEESNIYYDKLINIASSNSIKRESLVRLMIASEHIDKGLALNYAKRVIELEKIDDWLLSKAYIIIARDEFESGNYAKSRITFSKVTDLSDYNEGAEAEYFLAYLTYLDDDLDLAEQLVFKLSENYSNDHFIAKAFVLLADIYVANANLFQAKATLESIIENHDEEDLINVARKKWERIIEGEQEIIIDTIQEYTFIEIFEDNIEYEVEQIDDNYIVPMLDTLNTVLDSVEIINKNILDDEFK